MAFKSLTDAEINERVPALKALDDESRELFARLSTIGGEIVAAREAAVTIQTDAAAAINASMRELRAAEQRHQALVAAIQVAVRQATAVLEQLLAEQDQKSKRRATVKQLYSQGCEDVNRAEAARLDAEQAEREAVEAAEAARN